MVGRLPFMVLLASGWPGSLLAHPGHGTTPPDSAAHYALEPVHLLPVAVLIAAGVLIIWQVKRRHRTR